MDAGRGQGTQTKAFGEWATLHGGAGSLDAQELARGTDLARDRARELRTLMEHDPAAFVRQAMPETERVRLPAAIQTLIEKRVKGRGSFGTYCILPSQEAAEADTAESHRGGFGYEVRINGVPYQGFAYGKWRDAGTVYDADIEGVALDGAIAIGDSPTPSEQAAAGQTVTAYAPTTTGPNTLLYIIARFSDQTNDPVSDATVLSQMGVVSNFWLNNSSGTVSIHGLVNSGQVMDIVHVTLPQPSSYAATYNANFAQLLSDSRTAAQAAGYSYANYNLDVTVTTSSGFGYAGRSYVGGQGCHLVAGYTSLRTAGHELGHNLGLWHANYWRTDSTMPFGRDTVPGGYTSDASNSEWVEYGHYFSMMSAQYGGESDDATKPHYAPFEKSKLGWLSGSELQYVTASGTYRLFRHDERTTVGNPRGIRIETPATDYTGYGRRYWLGYRYAPWNTGLSWLRNGVQIDVAQTSYGSDGAIQLDMTPYSKDQSSPFFDPNNKPGGWWTIDNSDKVDGALVVGRSYDDVNAGIHITPLATGSNGTGEEYIDLVINLGTFGGNRSPIINAFTFSTNKVAAGQAVNFAVSATDPDGDTLAYSWDFDEVQVWTASGLNTNAATKSWSAAGQYRVVVRVSDMKGGVATATQIVTVGAPANTSQIWGRVVWAGRPVYGARVSSTVGTTVYQAWTDSDGSYVLTDLPASGSYTVACQAAGLTFTPQFTNPIAVSAGNVYGADFYANEALVGGGGSLYTVAGQVTDPVNGAAGVEVRAGGMVTATDASGNYQFTNFVNGTYAISARKDGWTFSPATQSVTVSSADSTGNNFSRVAPYSISGTFSGLPAGSKDPAPTVYLSNGRSVSATRTRVSGTWYWVYTLNNVPAGSYSVTAYLSGYSIAPSGFANPLSISSSISGANFTGTANANIAGAIAGRITQYGVPLSGVTVQANQGSSTIASVVSDSDGYYRVGNLVGGSYTIVPGKSGFSFSPGSTSASVPASSINFSATGPVARPSISSVTANPVVVASAAATTTLSAVASGAGPLTYSWDAVSAAAPVSFSVNDSTGTTATTVSFVAPGGYVFRARVTDTNGLASTATASVTVSAGAGTLVVSPWQVQVQAGQAASFRADAWDQLGNRISATPSWSVNGGGTIDAAGLFSAATPGGPYSVVAVASGLTATGQVWVTSASAAVPPAITTQPLSRTVVVGSNVTFSVVATGTAPLSYQWLLGGGAIAGATASSYTRMNVQPADAGTYSVVITNLAGTATSANALLTVIVPPAITTQPLGRAVAAGSNVTFSVVATGTAPLSYQWLLGGATIAGATGSSYTRTSVQPVDAGNYSVVVTNLAGAATSSNAMLTVNSAPILATIADQVIHAGSSLMVTNHATDLDVPQQSLAFSLDPGSPAGAAIGATNGILAWTTTAAQAGTTNGLTVRVTDDGTPSLSDTKNFLVTVIAPLTIRSVTVTNGSVTILWDSIQGTHYRVQHTADPAGGTWESLTPDVVAAGPTATVTETMRTGPLLYRVQLVQ